MKRQFKKIKFFFVALAFVSCSDEFLEMEPQGLRFEDNFYSTLDEIKEGLLAAYDLTAQKYTGTYTYHSSYMMRNIASDDANTGGGNALDMLEWQRIDEFSATPSNMSLMGHWWRSYFGIYRCNQIITRVDPDDNNLYQTPDDKALVKKYLAEAYFLRAYYYYELVTFFGGVPLVDRVINVSEDYPKRASKEKTWEFIENDLKAAIPDLPLKSLQASNELHRASKGAAQALLGKSYMLQGKYDGAAEILEEVIVSGEYRLDTSYAHIFSVDGEFGVESIFEISHSSTSPADWEAPWISGKPRYRAYEGNVDCQMMGVRELSGSSEYLPGWGFNKAETNLVNSFLDEGDTLRMEVSIYNMDSVKAREARDTTTTGKVTWTSDYKYTGWYCNKYAPKASNRGDNIGASELDYNVNERVIRYADILLLAAEAHMMKPSPDEAKTHEYINDIRERVGLADIDTNLSGDDLFDALVKERRLELAMEGHRYFDLIRWGMASDVLVNQPEATSNNYGSFIEGENELFPIPLQEMERSGGVLEQN